VTCRDWFQLSLKEGLTVFRDQQFSMDQGSAAVKRIGDVRALRAGQFREDAGPMAHPVRPDSYIAIDNFYTATVYNKGAEVVRMLHTTLGVDKFRAGMDAYIHNHDNSAVTIEDFVASLSQGGAADLSPFLAWYSQAGTPVLTVRDEYDADSKRYRLTLSQHTAPTPGQPTKQPLPIPVAIGLLTPNGDEVERRTLLLDRAEQTFEFEDIPAPPVPSLLRGFSAPVRLQGLPRERLRFLAAHDTDAFARWDSLQQYATALMLEQIAAWRPGQPAAPLDAGLHEAFASALDAADRDPAFTGLLLDLPGMAQVAAMLEIERWDVVEAVREGLRAQLGRALLGRWRETHARLTDTGPYRIDGHAIGVRSLRNRCLAYIAAGDPDEGIALAREQFEARRNMTDVLSALWLLTERDNPYRAPALAEFYERWRNDALVLDKWFSIQAMSPRADTLLDVRRLYGSADFSLRNPNRTRALVGSFTGNAPRFHDASGAGYAFLGEVLRELDPVNGQVAARMVNAFSTWRRQTPERAALIRAELERLRDQPGLSRWTAEKVALALA
jgi:aminopeptidase N